MATKELGPDALAVVQAVRNALADHGGAVVVATSGGADSLALAAGVAWVARRQPITPTAVVVDHGLQPGSDAVAAHAAEQCRGLGLAAVVETVAVVATGEGPEAAARAARYEALSRHEGPILLGHTLDDQAETVLLQLSRGAGPRALAGMAERRGRLVRPLLGLRRRTTVAACTQWGLEPWADPHNGDPRYARVRVRTEALPALEQALGPGFAEALARTATLVRRDVDCLEAIAESHPTPAELPVADLRGLPDAIRTRLLHRWLRSHGCEPTASHIAAVDTLLGAYTGQGPLDLPGVRVSRTGGYLRCT